MRQQCATVFVLLIIGTLAQEETTTTTPTTNEPNDDDETTTTTTETIEELPPEPFVDPFEAEFAELQYEHQLAYFREDIGVNMYHGHWHFINPYNGTLELVFKPRRGEQFYFMHSQIVARYDAERISNGMKRVLTYNDWREPVREAYFSPLLRFADMQPYPGRPPNATLQDLNRQDESGPTKVVDIERWRDNIIKAIDDGYAIAENGTHVPLNHETGINILGNMMQANILSPNVPMYGSYHNTGHRFFAYVHSPDVGALQDVGVMGENISAMRDPIFYRFHKHLEDMFVRHKRLQQQYTRDHLAYENVNVNSIAVQVDRENVTRNLLMTYWQRSQVLLPSGLAVSPLALGRSYLSFVHMQHAKFNYEISVSNNADHPLNGTVRIFITPRCEENCETFDDRRLLMIEMDKFTVNLLPGDNNITRSSVDTSAAMPWHRLFLSVYQAGGLSSEHLEAFEICGCHAWPDHMLVPRGSVNGTKFDMYVMVSNYQNDTIEDQESLNEMCREAHDFCSFKDPLLLDLRSMGFPFDRPHNVSTLEEFVDSYSNMLLTEITVKFDDSFDDP